MKKTFLNTLALGILLFLGACTATPEACFTADKDKGGLKTNEEIQFSPLCSKDADAYTWDFGDGTTSFEATTKHKYSVKGSYTVKLTASNKSKSGETSQIIVIN